MTEAASAMFPALFLGLFTASGAVALPPHPVLDQKAACRLAHREATATGRVYSIRGQYLAQEYAPILTPDGCDLAFLSELDGEAAVRDMQYHAKFYEKCHGHLMNTVISGIFTGTFIRDKSPHRVLFGGRSMMIRSSRFIVNGIESQGFDPSMISCGQ